MARIIPGKYNSTKLIEIVTPDIAEVVERAKTGIKRSEDGEMINFYSLRLLLWIKDGQSVKNRGTV